MSEKYDLIVVGAGNGGLMAACRASMMGLKTLVIEKHNMVGGAATSFVRGRFEFEASLHEIPDFGEGDARGELAFLFDELGIKVDWLKIPDAYRLVVAENAEVKLDATVPVGRKEVADYMQSVAPGGAAAMERLFASADVLRKGLEYVGMTRGRPDLDVMEKQYPNAARIFGATAGELFRALDIPQACIDILGAYWPYQGADIESIDASRYLMMIDGYLSSGAYMPRMRSHEIANSIQKRARELGCDFWMETEVVKICTKRGAVSGIMTADGRSAEATAVISNVIPDIVYGKLLDEPRLTPEFELKKANARSYGSRGFCVCMGLDRSAEELGIKDYSLFLNSSCDTKYQFERSCTLEGIADNLAVTCLSVVNPDAAPAGACHFMLTTSFGADVWTQVKPEDYLTVKRDCADKMIRRYEQVMGVNIHDHIEEIAIATPVTFARYMGTPQGAIYGYATSSWDGMTARTLVGSGEMTVPGLFFAGAHGNKLSGYFPTLTNGDLIAKQAMGYIMGGGK